MMVAGPEQLCVPGTSPRSWGSSVDPKSTATKNVVKIRWLLTEAAANSMGDVKRRYLLLWKEGVAIKESPCEVPKSEEIPKSLLV